MKKILPLLVFVILFLNGLGAVALHDKQYEKELMTDKIVISEPEITDIDDYVSVNLKEAKSFLLGTGKPMLPVVTKIFTFPLGTKIIDVSVDYEVEEYRLSKKIQPAPVPVILSRESSQASTELIPDETVYSSSTLYPLEPCNISKGAGLHKGEHVLFLNVKITTQYNPVENILYVPKEIGINVVYAPPSETPLFVNDGYDMVIIAPSEFSLNLQPLIDHKNSHGVQTILKTTEEIYGEYEGRDETEQIKYFIKNAIENWNIRFVLLVGGAEQLPGRYTHIYYDDFNLYPTPNEWVFLSDLYYADIFDEELKFSSWDTNENDVFAEYNWYGNTDELDLYPDVYLGRLACINEDEVIACVNKIITYEVEKAYEQDWFTNLVVIGGDSLPGDEEHIDEGEYVHEHVIEILDGFTPIKIWASNGELRHISNINDAINNGAGFVFFNGHGHLDLWGTHPHENNNKWLPSGFYKNPHINELSNEDKLPIVVSDACYHCTYNVKSDCFGWTFVKNPNGGAIAFLGGTDIDLSYGGVDIITKGVEKLCLELSTHYMEGAGTFGELWGESLSTYISYSMDEIDYITVEESQPFGDPSLAIAERSLAPEKPTITGQSSGKTGVEYTYNASTTDPNGDQIYYLFDWGDGSNSEWIGPIDSGETANAPHIWEEKGNYEIKVKAKDEYGLESEWSDPLPINMPKNKAINTQFLQFLDNHPHLFPLLRQLPSFGDLI
jgi:Peptidase family C25/PKD domain